MRWIRHGRKKKQLRRLPFPGAFHLNAAAGWLELGNQAEALAEWGRLSLKQRGQADARYVRWRIFASVPQWRRCLAIARAFTERVPEDPRSWIVLARSFCHTGRLQQAYAIATRQMPRFPWSWDLFYDGACYACRLGRLAEADRFLRSAISLNAEMWRRARQDPDLEQLRRSGSSESA